MNKRDERSENRGGSKKWRRGMSDCSVTGVCKYEKSKERVGKNRRRRRRRRNRAIKTHLIIYFFLFK